MLDLIQASAGGAGQAVRATRGRRRVLILALISVGTIINYLDRAVLGIAAPLLTSDLGLGAAALGVVFSAFSWTYAAAQIPGGVLLDRYGTRIVYFLSVGFWSLFTMLQGAVGGLSSLLGCRLGLGLAEAPCYPANSRVFGTWFPQSERARANGACSVGQYFGLALLSPVLYWIASTWGWRALFFLAGALGLAFAAVWLNLYREPDQSPGVTRAEIEYIEAGGGLGRGVEKAPFSWYTLRRLITQRQFLGAALGQFASNTTLVFLLTWFPVYLTTARHMHLRSIGLLAVLPYMSASAGVLLGGCLSDWLIKKTGSATIARKLPIVTGLMMATTIFAANYVDSNKAVVGIMSFVFFGQGMCNLGWTLITEVAPRQYMGLTGGLFNLCANLAGIVTPLVIGLIVGGTGSYFGALMFIGGVALVGVLAYVFVLGDVRRIELPGP